MELIQLRDLRALKKQDQRGCQHAVTSAVHQRVVAAHETENAGRNQNQAAKQDGKGIVGRRGSMVGPNGDGHTVERLHDSAKRQKHEKPSELTSVRLEANRTDIVAVKLAVPAGNLLLLLAAQGSLLGRSHHGQEVSDDR
jgi:hypothetical protein